ncbi:hypothetical protein Efla_005535 [Eimeria flavescens]
MLEAEGSLQPRVPRRQPVSVLPTVPPTALEAEAGEDSQDSSVSLAACLLNVDSEARWAWVLFSLRVSAAANAKRMGENRAAVQEAASLPTGASWERGLNALGRGWRSRKTKDSHACGEAAAASAKATQAASSGGGDCRFIRGIGRDEAVSGQREASLSAGKAGGFPASPGRSQQGRPLLDSPRAAECCKQDTSGASSSRSDLGGSGSSTLRLPPSQPLRASQEERTRSASIAAGSKPTSSSEGRGPQAGRPFKGSERLSGKTDIGCHEPPSQAAAKQAVGTPEEAEELGSSCAFCVAAGSTCVEHLLQQYHRRLSVFEQNCSQRYGAILEVVVQKRRTSSLLKLGVSAPESQKQKRGFSPLQTRPRKGESEGSEVTSSSGDEPTSQRADAAAKAAVSSAEGSPHFAEGGFVRRTKTPGQQRSFPYRQFHVHHFLPEPANKVGLVTHPTPAQFNKYPKARGVWFDPHRNLVRTCWKENGKARTMGFPVNKFGLEEARTLAVEYHYYKCPSDPLPDDLLSLVPRKPPHAYGWC